MLRATFPLKDLGQLYYFLGIETSTTTYGSLYLYQTQYICDLLNRTNMLQSNPQSPSMFSSLWFKKDAFPTVQDLKLYKSVVGAPQHVVITYLNCPLLSIKFFCSCILLKNTTGVLSSLYYSTLQGLFIMGYSFNAIINLLLLSLVMLIREWM